MSSSTTNNNSNKRFRRDMPYRNTATLPTWWMELTPHFELDWEDEQARLAAQERMARYYAEFVQGDIDTKGLQLDIDGNLIENGSNGGSAYNSSWQGRQAKNGENGFSNNNGNQHHKPFGGRNFQPGSAGWDARHWGISDTDPEFDLYQSGDKLPPDYVTAMNNYAKATGRYKASDGEKVTLNASGDQAHKFGAEKPAFTPAYAKVKLRNTSRGASVRSGVYNDSPNRHWRTATTAVTAFSKPKTNTTNNDMDENPNGSRFRADPRNPRRLSSKAWPPVAAQQERDEAPPPKPASPPKLEPVAETKPTPVPVVTPPPAREEREEMVKQQPISMEQEEDVMEEEIVEEEVMEEEEEFVEEEVMEEEEEEFVEEEVVETEEPVKMIPMTSYAQEGEEEAKEEIMEEPRAVTPEQHEYTDHDHDTPPMSNQQNVRSSFNMSQAPEPVFMDHPKDQKPSQPMSQEPPATSQSRSMPAPGGQRAPIAPPTELFDLDQQMDRVAMAERAKGLALYYAEWAQVDEDNGMMCDIDGNPITPEKKDRRSGRWSSRSRKRSQSPEKRISSSTGRARNETPTKPQSSSRSASATSWRGRSRSPNRRSKQQRRSKSAGGRRRDATPTRSVFAWLFGRRRKKSKMFGGVNYHPGSADWDPTDWGIDWTNPEYDYHLTGEYLPPQYVKSMFHYAKMTNKSFAGDDDVYLDAFLNPEAVPLAATTAVEEEPASRELGQLPESGPPDQREVDFAFRAPASGDLLIDTGDYDPQDPSESSNHPAPVAVKEVPPHVSSPQTPDPVEDEDEYVEEEVVDEEDEEIAEEEAEATPMSVEKQATVVVAEEALPIEKAEEKAPAAVVPTPGPTAAARAWPPPKEQSASANQSAPKPRTWPPPSKQGGAPSTSVKIQSKEAAPKTASPVNITATLGAVSPAEQWKQRKLAEKSNPPPPPMNKPAESTAVETTSPPAPVAAKAPWLQKQETSKSVKKVWPPPKKEPAKASPPARYVKPEKPAEPEFVKVKLKGVAKEKSEPPATSPAPAARPRSWPVPKQPVDVAKTEPSEKASAPPLPKPSAVPVMKADTASPPSEPVVKETEKESKVYVASSAPKANVKPAVVPTKQEKASKPTQTASAEKKDTNDKSTLETENKSRWPWQKKKQEGNTPEKKPNATTQPAKAAAGPKPTNQSPSAKASAKKTAPVPAPAPKQASVIAPKKELAPKSTVTIFGRRCFTCLLIN